MDRRNFLKTAGSTSLFAALGIHVTSCNVSDNEDLPPGIELVDGRYRIDTTVSSFTVLTEDGGWKNIEEIGVIVINIDGTNIRAFDNRCPHEGCRDAWLFLDGVLRCNCHNSRFTSDGALLQGPAEEDLTDLAASRDGDFIFVDKP